MNYRADYDKADWTKTDVQLARKFGVTTVANAISTITAPIDEE
jgi:hypothetical protein